jgi:ParB family chromosome partitioning protein
VLQETSQRKQEQSTEQIIRIPLTDLHPYPYHPYGIREDQAMQDTVDSVKQNGVVVPAIVRPRAEGGYEIVAGHRRKLASERAGFTDMPCIVRNLTDDEAIIQLVDSNAQREDVLPSERAKAYKMRLEAIKRTAGRPPRQAQENSPNNSANFRSDDEVGNTDGISGDTVRNIISLNNLVPELMQMVDDKKISLTPAYQIAALTEPEQRLLIETMDSEQATPSVSQAQRMRRLSQTGELNEDNMLRIMMEQKKPQAASINIPLDKLRKYFPKTYSPARIEETIFKLLDQWLKRRQRSQER